MDRFEEIRGKISDWLNEHPYTIDVTSGALEAVPFVGPVLSKIFERSTQPEDDKIKIVEFLRTVQDATDEQLERLSGKLDGMSRGVEGLSVGSLRILSLSEKTNDKVDEIARNVNTLLHQSEQAKGDFWRQFDLTLGALEELIDKHVKLIEQAVAPLVDGRPDGLEATAVQFRALVFNNELPSGYAKAHAYLDEWTSIAEFRNAVNQAKINAVRSELSIFQYAVFPMMSESAYLGDFGFGSATKLWLLLTRESAQALDIEKLQRDTRSNFLLAFEWLTQERSWYEAHGRKILKSRITENEYKRMLAISQLNTPDGVLKPVNEWCREWQYLVSQQLWDGILKVSITKLRNARYDFKAKPER